MLTFFLIASKHEELDDNIPLIKDLTRYFCRVLPTSVSTPTFEEIVECERSLMIHFKWDLMIITPSVIVQSLMANGIVFDNEDIEVNEVTEIVRKISERVNSILDVLVKELHQFRDKKATLLACVVIYLARKEEFSLLKS